MLISNCNLFFYIINYTYPDPTLALYHILHYKLHLPRHFPGPTSHLLLITVDHPSRATTHTDLIIRAVEKGVKYTVVHNASIMNAIGCCGLQVFFLHFDEASILIFFSSPPQALLIRGEHYISPCRLYNPLPTLSPNHSNNPNYSQPHPNPIPTPHHSALLIQDTVYNWKSKHYLIPM